MTSVPTWLGRAREIAAAATPRTLASFFAQSRNGRGELYLYGQIGADMFGDGITARDVSEALAGIGNKPLDVYVNSPGGSVTESAAVSALLDRHPGPKAFFVDGIAASAASVLLTSPGAKVVAHESSTIMIHDPWVGAIGGSADLRAVADTLDKFAGIMAAAYARKSGKPVDTIAAAMSAETWFTAAEALAYGLVDSISTAAPVLGVERGNVIAYHSAALAQSGREAEALRRAALALKSATPGGGNNNTH